MYDAHLLVKHSCADVCIDMGNVATTLFGGSDQKRKASDYLDEKLVS